MTGPVPMPGGGAAGGGTAGAGSAGGECGSAWTVLQLSSSPKIAPRHTFLLTDLGELTPVHLTYTPRAAERDQGSGATGATGEATAAPALRSWAHTACGLGELRGRGVRSVDDWEFAQQRLPEGGGPAAWVCTRAETWRGPGQAVVRVVTGSSPAAAPGAVAARAERTGACGRFSRPVLAGLMWKSLAGHWFLVAAGNGEVNRIEASGGVRAIADGSLLSVRAERGARATLTARLSSGGTQDALT